MYNESCIIMRGARGKIRSEELLDQGVAFHSCLKYEYLLTCNCFPNMHSFPLTWWNSISEATSYLLVLDIVLL